MAWEDALQAVTATPAQVFGRADHGAIREGAVANLVVWRSVDDDVLLQLGWYGTPQDDATEALGAYADAGLDHLVARVVVVGDDVEGSIEAVLQTLAPDRVIDGPAAAEASRSAR